MSIALLWPEHSRQGEMVSEVFAGDTEEAVVAEVICMQHRICLGEMVLVRNARTREPFAWLLVVHEPGARSASSETAVLFDKWWPERHASGKIPRRSMDRWGVICMADRSFPAPSVLNLTCDDCAAGSQVKTISMDEIYSTRLSHPWPVRLRR